MLAFLLESLMLAWIPAATVTAALGGGGFLPIATATFVGVPAYLNGYAALPLVSGLIEQGMAPSACAMTFEHGRELKRPDCSGPQKKE